MNGHAVREGNAAIADECIDVIGLVSSQARSSQQIEHPESFLGNLELHIGVDQVAIADRHDDLPAVLVDGGYAEPAQ